MFNLLIRAGGWDAAGRDDLLANRVFERTEDDLIARFTRDGRPAFDQLMTLPTLFAAEGVNNEVARLGTITGVRNGGRNLFGLHLRRCRVWHPESRIESTDAGFRDG